MPEGLEALATLSCLQVGKLEGLESEVDQLQRVLQSVAAELESGHQTAQVSRGTRHLGMTVQSWPGVFPLLLVMQMPVDCYGKKQHGPALHVWLAMHTPQTSQFVP